MARDYTFSRQEAESLVDLLEANPNYQLHDHTALEMAAEFREMFGMCSREESLKIEEEMANDTRPPKIIELKVDIYPEDFSKIKITPDTPPCQNT